MDLFLQVAPTVEFTLSSDALRCVLCSTNRRHLPPEVQRQVSFEVLSAEDAINEGEADGCDVLIVDPPRKVSYPYHSSNVEVVQMNYPYVGGS